MASNENRNTRLQELGGSDFEIADGQPDIRGWDVKDAQGRRIGEVDELIFDVQSRKVRYIVLDLDGNELDLEARDVLVPIGLAELHENDDEVILSGVTADQLTALPEYDDDNLGNDVETSIRNVFGGIGTAAAGASMSAGATTGDTDFYNHEHFNDENLYRNRQQRTNEGATIPVIQENLEVGKREVERGGIHIRSRIEERPVEENIRLREEEIHVERENVDRPVSASDFDRVGEQDVELTERVEVPVVNKETRVVEEINISKDVTERDETVKDTVRNTEVDIENIDRGTNRTDIDRDEDLDDEDDSTRPSRSL